MGLSVFSDLWTILAIIIAFFIIDVFKQSFLDSWITVSVVNKYMTLTVNQQPGFDLYEKGKKWSKKFTELCGKAEAEGATLGVAAASPTVQQVTAQPAVAPMQTAPVQPMMQQPAAAPMQTAPVQPMMQQPAAAPMQQVPIMAQPVQPTIETPVQQVQPVMTQPAPAVVPTPVQQVQPVMSEPVPAVAPATVETAPVAQPVDPNQNPTIQQ